ncbi:paraquat-inducible protein A [Pedobacter sp. SL55]|uniref:paraquat-inducible protein A n=1 Tax=Pedobacter sp. SL55 TaxID=2995161 RepID=UPI002270C47C|nr:paraquat-inducible protein A [Pedobacter sp. SL55]WAC39914.1 paraquat-inducible protein A [Pedobacter sp. SL55]
MKTASRLERKMLPHIALIMVLASLLFATSYFGHRLYSLSAEQEQLKEDYATINNITFGVFSLDLWTDKLSAIVNEKIKGFKISKEQRKEMKEEVEKQLHGMINEVVSEFEKPQKGLGNKLKKFAFKQLVDPKELHDQVPSFAQTIINRINSPRSINKLKGIASTEFNELAEQTYDSTATAQAKITKHLYQKYRVANLKSFNNHLESRFNSIRKVTYYYAYAMLTCALVVICLWLPLRKKTHLHNTLFTFTLLIGLALLIVGVTVSIIEVDARISVLELHLLGEKLVFNNQVLFFQSKSILGIAKVLIQQPKPDSVTVGILIILFVIILPLLRMVARGIHTLCKPVVAENKITQYLAFESDKWDMADVMVIGILMTYIGLNGILKSQLTDLNIKSDVLATTTVNYTSLQPGYLIFVGYVILTFLVSYILRTITCPPDKNMLSSKD